MANISYRKCKQLFDFPVQNKVSGLDKNQLLALKRKPELKQKEL